MVLLVCFFASGPVTSTPPPHTLLLTFFTSLHFELNLKYFIRVLNTSPHACNVCIFTCTFRHTPNLQLIRSAVCSCYLTKESMFRKSRNLCPPGSIHVLLQHSLKNIYHDLKNLLDYWPKYRLFYVMNDTNRHFTLIGVGTRFVLVAYYM